MHADAEKGGAHMRVATGHWRVEKWTWIFLLFFCFLLDRNSTKPCVRVADLNVVTTLKAI
jgi:hypothetical protein